MKFQILLIFTLIIQIFTVTVTYTQTQQPGIILNPERGFYYHTETQDVEYNKSIMTPHNENNIWWINHTPLNYDSSWFTASYSVTLIMRIYYLRSFKNKPLSQAQLNAIASDLDVVRRQNLKTIIRFSYSLWQDEPDAPLSVVLNHINQLKPVFENNKDVILTIQAGFIGTWGEWYYTSPELKTVAGRTSVINGLLNMVPSPIMVQIRTPLYKQEIFGTGLVTSTNAFNKTGDKKSRVAHHNDCFLADNTDMGTYQSNNIEGDKTYLSADTQYLIMGGETCQYNPSINEQITECAYAQNDLRRFHFTYLNLLYNSGVISKWQNQGCYATIQNDLGYKLFLKSFDISTTSFSLSNTLSSLTYTFVVSNNGYGAPVNFRPIEIVLYSAARTLIFNVAVANSQTHDVRYWLRERGDITVTGTITRQNVIDLLNSKGITQAQAVGTYSLKLRLPDGNTSLYGKVPYSIRFANNGVFDSTNGWNNLSLNLNLVTGTTLSNEDVVEDLDSDDYVDSDEYADEYVSDESSNEDGDENVEIVEDN